MDSRSRIKYGTSFAGMTKERKYTNAFPKILRYAQDDNDVSVIA
jgi:hypothetical protein